MKCVEFMAFTGYFSRKTRNLHGGEIMNLGMVLSDKKQFALDVRNVHVLKFGFTGSKI